MWTTFSTKTLLILYIIIITKIIQTTGISNHIELFHGGQFEKIEKAIIYHSTIPITIEIPTSFEQLTHFLQTRQQYTTCPFETNSTCKIFSTMKSIEDSQIFEETNYRIENNNPNKNEGSRTNNNNPRNRRAIEAIGDIFHWCCALVTDHELGPYIKTEDEITHHVNNLQEFMKAEHKDLVENTHHLNRMSKEIEHLISAAKFSMNTWQKKFQSEEKSALEITTENLLNTMIRTTALMYLGHLKQRIEEIRIQCNNRRLSTRAVTQDELRRKIIDIQKKIYIQNYTVAFPIDDIQHIYELPITSCIETKTKLHIILKLPIKQNVNTSLYHATSIPLYWKNKTCSILDKNQFVIQQEEDIVLLSPDDEGKCNRQLCGVPRRKIINSENHRCIKYLMTEANMTTIQGVCSFKCKKMESTTTITKIREDVFLIHNVKPDTFIECDGEKQAIPIDTAGTLQIHIPCNCQVKEENHILITKLYPCDQRATSKTKVTQLLPISWTNLPSLSIPTTENTKLPNFLDLDAILDNNWHLNLTDFNSRNIFTNDILEEINMPSDWTKFKNNSEIFFWLILGWQTALTLIILFILIKTYIKSKALKMLQNSSTSVNMSMKRRRRKHTNELHNRDNLI